MKIQSSLCPCWPWRQPFIVGVRRRPRNQTQDARNTSSAEVFGGPTGTTDLRVPDLEFHPELDPLKVTTAGNNLVTFMSKDSSTSSWATCTITSTFPTWANGTPCLSTSPHRTEDTAMVRMQREMMDKWFHKGLRNRAGGAHIRYVSPWVEEDDQRVALLGLDLNYFLDFFENFEGNPEGMRLSFKTNTAATPSSGTSLTKSTKATPP